MKKRQSLHRGLIIFFMGFSLIRPLYGQLELGQQVLESTMTRYTPANFGNWAYPRGFYLFAQYRFWKMTGDDRYFQYMRNWVDQHVDSQGHIDADITSLDNSEPGLVTLFCYEETGEQKYKLAADYIRNVYHTYPRTSDDAFWHNMWAEGQIWSDGVYMILPFLVHYGRVFNEPELYTECAHQLITYASHLQDESGLLFHAYDEDGSSEWADPVTRHSPWFWGRAIGWFGMALIEVLDIIPEDHPDRQALIDILARLIHGLSEVQDAPTGLFYQVVDQGQRADNWLESSCSCMYSYFTARAIEKGFADASCGTMAKRAYEGVLRDKFSVDSQGLTYLKDICQGTSVSSDYAYYYNRGRNTNDQHGLGAFLMMCWQMARSGTDLEGNSAPIVTFITPGDSALFWPGTDILLSVSGIDLDGEVVQVAFYADNTLLGTDGQAPWEWTWNNAPEGLHTLTATATDDSGATTESDPLIVIVTDDKLIIEAEDGSLHTGTVDNNHTGYSGTGFVNLDNQAGTWLDLNVDLPEDGPWAVRIYYANGTTDSRPCEIRIDGNVIEESLDFPPTGEWTDWTYSGEILLDLDSGRYTLRITGLVSSGAPNLDHLELVCRETGNGGTSLYFEAEENAVFSAGSVDAEHAGFTGSGYVNLENQAGSYLETGFTLPRSGTWNMRIHYANGTADNRPCEIRIDGNVIEESLDFPPTGEWTGWTYSETLSLELDAGSHTMRITGLEAASAPNLDHLEMVLQAANTPVGPQPVTWPDRFMLSRNYPNPFNSRTIIRYHLPENGRVQVTIYDVIGNEVACLIDEPQEAGSHQVRFDGQALASGMYVAELRAAGTVLRNKMILMK
ncbi:glycoside hydrolase family 88 protein [bacterium]|nr:glycoside hydrolase family 88 protein [bacterium]